MDEVLYSKAASIERCVVRAREEYRGHAAEFAVDLTHQDAAILNVQRACETAIDMANRTIKLRRLAYPKDSKESFAVLAGAGLIERSLSERLQKMVGFRNVAVHQYQELDLARVVAVIEHGLDDLLAFSKAMLQADPAP